MKNLTDFEPIPEHMKARFYRVIDPIVRAATRLNIHPNTFTSVSFLFGCLAAYLMITGQIRLAALGILLSGLCDALDGKLARYSGKVTRFGALYDSTLDRYSEVIFFLGMAYFFISHENYLTSVAVAVGLGGSMMVSYVRARAEGLGFDCKVGILQRAERLLLLGLGGLIHPWALAGSVWIIAVLSNITAIQRIVHVWKEDHKSTIPTV